MMPRRLRRLIPIGGSILICFLVLFFMPRLGADFTYYLSLGFALVTLLLSGALYIGIPPLKNLYKAILGMILIGFLFSAPSLWGMEGFAPLWILFGALALINIDQKKRALISLGIFLVAFVLAFFPMLRFLAYAFLAIMAFVYAFLAKDIELFCIFLSIGLSFTNAAFGYLPEKTGISYSNSFPLFALTFGINYGLFRSLWKVRNANMEMAKKETTLSNIEEKALKEEIQPHFLLNALNNVRVAYHESKERGQKQLGELRNLEERIYATIDKSFIPLSAEVEIIRALIDLYNTDRQRDISLVLDIEDDTLPVPPMLLEPLVENSLQHSGVLQQDGGEITLEEREEYGVAIIRLADNGHGQPLPSNSRGIGLSNVMKRVSLLENGHMSIDSNEDGTSIEISFVPEREDGDFFARFGRLIEE